MVMLSYTSIEFVVILDKEYNYFDIIPDLEKKFRKRFRFDIDYCNGSTTQILKVINAEDTYQRFYETSFYKEHYDRYGQPKMSVEGKNNFQTIEDLPIKITERENILTEEIISFLGDKVASSKWRVGTHDL